MDRKDYRPLAIFLWAFAEPMFWPVLPDYALVLLCLFAPAKWRTWCAIAWCGSMAGMWTMLAVCTAYPDWVGTWLFRTPFTHFGMAHTIANTASWLQPFSGVPVKVWIFADKLDTLNGFASVAAARLARMVATSAISAFVGMRFRNYLAHYGVPVALVYSAIFLWLLAMTSAPKK